MSFFWAWVQYSGMVVGFQFGGASKVRREAGRPAGRPAAGRTVVGLDVRAARVSSAAPKKNHLIEAAPFGRLNQM